MDYVKETMTKQPPPLKLPDGLPLIPVRMLNEFVYCPRLAYLMWVQNEFAHNECTVDGTIRHRRVDKGGGTLPEHPAEETKIHARSVSLSSEALGITAKIDLVEGAGNVVSPVDYKQGKRPHIEGGVYEPERVQRLLRKEHGFA
ncbi:MAG: Dna2/Cas4 domain-containing protein [Smithellaceae bacterium]|nr:Dna2/Cas4 domain-containing protein [Smithellaceae bacterium]